MPLFEGLRDRELEILRLVATGASNKEIANLLHISTNTVKVHLRNIFAKIGVSSRTEAAMFAVNKGLIAEAMKTSPDEVFHIGSEIHPDDDIVTDTAQIGVKESVEIRRDGTVWFASGVVLIIILIVSVGVAWLVGLNNSNKRITEISGPSPTEISAWEGLTPLPESRSGLALVSYENQVYMIGGMTAQGVTGAVDYYDPISNRWKANQPKPLPVKDISAVVIAGKIYVPGGTTESNEVTDRLEIFDPRRNIWVQGARLPVGLSSYALASFDGSMYLFGGWDGERVLGTVYMYNPVENQWTSMPAMPTARRYLGAAVSGRRIFVIGGLDEKGPLPSNESFNPDLLDNQQSAWEIDSPLPEPAYGMGVASVADTLYVIGGIGSSTSRRYPILTFDQTQGWRIVQSSPDEVVAFHGLTSLGKYLYLAGGEVDHVASMNFLRFQAVYTISLPIIVK